jgi:hypothetical protein
MYASKIGIDRYRKRSHHQALSRLQIERKKRPPKKATAKGGTILEGVSR